MLVSHFLPCLLFFLIQDVCLEQLLDDYEYPEVDIDLFGIQNEERNNLPDYTSNSYLTSSHKPPVLTEGDHKPRRRTKRGIWNLTDRNWPHNVPFVISNSYKGNINRFRRVLKYISSRVCVQFHDVTHTRNPKNPTWLTSNGFETNSYVEVSGTSSGCTSPIGQGIKPGRRVIYPCDSFDTNLHEMTHMLGGIHTQKMTQRSSHIAIHFGNVVLNYRKTYQVNNNSAINSYSFDPGSMMLYHRKGFSSNGFETYTYIRDDADYFDIPSSHENVIFMELNQVYRCNELFCNNDQTDCSPGYHALVDGVCRCVCPDDLDPATKCKQLINKPTSNINWPKTPVVLFGANGCPAEFEQDVRMLPISGLAHPTQDAAPFPIPSVNYTLQFPICVKRQNTAPADSDWLSWPPGGNYCILQKRRVPCGGAFKDGSLQITTSEALRPAGSIGATDVVGNTVYMKFCCQNEDPHHMVLALPNGHAFRWIAYGSCPQVRGMAVTNSKITMSLKKVQVSGALPPKHVYKRETLELSQCVYIPPVYGCNKVLTLDSKTRSVKVTTPGFGSAREPNRRCFYAFNNPKNSRLRLTFNKYDLHENDKFLVKKYNQWLDPARIKNNNCPHQIVSVGDYLSLEYWSSWEVTTHTGVDFKVDLLLGEEFCYDLKRNGEDYVGDKSVSETYEECLPWATATSCDDFPFDEPSLLASGNTCRNPGGKLDEPWCYTFINGSECHKRYCDVCNIKTPQDKLDNCKAFLAADHSFCDSAVQRFGCFKTCDFSLQDFKPAGCGRPTFPLDGVPANKKVLTNYKQGDNITVMCKSSALLTNQITCTKNGWTKLSSACRAESCRDESSACEDILMAFPNFCLDSRFSVSSAKFCSKSCGRCPGDIKCLEAVSKHYTRTSSKSAVKPGDVMSFTCAPGLYHVGGNLQMACSVSGRLLGVEPVCSPSPGARDIKLETVRRRFNSLPIGVAVLLDHADYRIPFKGKVTKWYYYCKDARSLTFIIYQKNRKIYKYVGSNTITCLPDWKMEYIVPADAQISVSEGDVYGVFSEHSDSLSISNCNDAHHKILQLPSAKATTLSELTKSHQTFSHLFCAVPSLGLRIEP